ncbi:MAG: leucyl aminopeptidase family protein [Pseudomonadota bacterium]
MSLVLSATSRSSTARPLHVLDAAGFKNWIARQSAEIQTYLEVIGFGSGFGEILVVPNLRGGIECVLLGAGSETDRKRHRFLAGRCAHALPEGDYVLETPPQYEDLETFALGWVLGGYQFDRYRSRSQSLAKLVAPEGLDKAKVDALAGGETLTRNLINTPASDMTPSDLEAAAHSLAQSFGARFSVITGEDLKSENFPMIHAVGRASDVAPRLIDFTWGTVGPRVTLVGKGVCFDTGGLNIKPGGSMGLMKKDMGGSAAVLGLAHMIMSTGLKVKLRVLIPAVENSISAGAFRPQDILKSRKGLTVEINNTDAEGRLVLADALALADETPPDLLISMATLTGAARVAVGPDLAPFYCDNLSIAGALEGAGFQVADPLWRMPFWDPYETMIEPGIADLDNAPKGGFAGSITAALFLRRFVTQTQNYIHFDIYGWQPSDAPARPKGGVGQGTRAVFAALPEILNL